MSHYSTRTFFSAYGFRICISIINNHTYLSEEWKEVWMSRMGPQPTTDAIMLWVPFQPSMTIDGGDGGSGIPPRWNRKRWFRETASNPFAVCLSIALGSARWLKNEIIRYSIYLLNTRRGGGGGTRKVAINGELKWKTYLFSESTLFFHWIYRFNFMLNQNMKLFVVGALFSFSSHSKMYWNLREKNDEVGLRWSIERREEWSAVKDFKKKKDCTEISFSHNLHFNLKRYELWAFNFFSALKIVLLNRLLFINLFKSSSFSFTWSPNVL